MDSVWCAWLLIAVSLFAFCINLYFVSLSLKLPAWMEAFLHGGARVCGIDGGTCRVVYKTQYAKLFGRIPNIVFGLAWNIAVIGCSSALLVTGSYPFWNFSLFVACASVAVGIYLTIVLIFILRKPCPL